MEDTRGNAADREITPRIPSAEIERVATNISSSSASTASSNSTRRRHAAGTSISRTTTERDLERHPTVAHRVQTARLQHVSTVGRSETRGTSRRDGQHEMPGMGLGKPMPPDLPDRDDYVVEFEGPDDPLHAQNWPMKKKVYMAAILASTSFFSVFASGIFAPTIPIISRTYDVGHVVATLGVSFFVFGFAVGPLVWAPLSELRGRKLPLVIAMFGFSIFEVGVATAENLQTILLCRFFAGAFASAPLAIVAAYFADVFSDRARGLAIVIFSMTVFAGPLMAPFIGGFIVINVSWRWTQWLCAFAGFFSFALILFFLEESYPPIVLISKAAEIRRRTKNWGIHAKQEEIEVDFRELIERNFSRPIRMLISEPILLGVTLYMSFIYGLLYLFLTAYALVFQGNYGMNPGVAGLPYFGLIVGTFCGAIFIALYQKVYLRKLDANNGVGVPEWRLPPVIVGGLGFAGGLFWFGWSGYTGKVHWIAPTLSGLLTGFGLLTIFISCLSYIVDAYLMFAASAIAANTLLRSLAGGAFPLFARQMFEGMGIEWASTLLGCVALILVPIPLLFIKYGSRLREKSEFAPTAPVGLPQDDEEAMENEEKTGTVGERVTDGPALDRPVSKADEMV